MNLEYARLDRDGIEKLKSLEETLGTTVVAFQKPLKMAQLSQEQLATLKALEDELGIVLLAYDDEQFAEAEAKRRRGRRA